MKSAEDMAVLTRGIVQVIPEAELVARLAAGRPLRVKFGVDPTAPDIHLGHTVPLAKLRQFQDRGHTVVLIVGDFTARIGDPSGKNAMRPPLSREAVEANARTYEAQVFKLLDPARTEVRRNSEWLERLALDEVLRLAGQVTVARMLERDDFHRRYRAGSPIGLHEFFYPLLQGYDSLVVRADVEVGGTDQMFNLLVGRDVQRLGGMAEQVVMVLPLLEGIDGVQKMSKSLGNHIGVTDPPRDMFGRIMSISDPLMVRFYGILSSEALQRITAIRDGAVHPMEAKKALAREIVQRYHGAVAADDAARFFEERFQRRQPHAPALVTVPSGAGDVWICQLMKDVGFVSSTSEARRLLAQGAVRVDGHAVSADFHFRPGSHRMLAVGKRRLVEIVPGPPGVH